MCSSDDFVQTYLRAAEAARVAAIATLRVHRLDDTSAGIVIIDDARSRFARYLKSEGIGQLHSRGGWAVPILPRALPVAAAEAFAAILRADGISVAL